MEEDLQQQQQSQQQQTSDQGMGGTEGQSQSQGSGEAGGTGGQPSLVGLSQDDLRKLVSGVADAVRPQEQQRQWTQEEFNRAFNVYEVPPDALARLGFTEEQVPLLREFYHTMRDGLVRQAATLSGFQLQQAREALLAELSDVRAFAREQMEAKATERFYTKYPKLKDYDVLLREIRDRVVAEGKKFPDEDAAFAEIAKRAEAVLAKLPLAAAGANGNGSATKMSSVSAGGQGGAGSGGSGQSGGKQPNWMKVYATQARK